MIKTVLIEFENDTTIEYQPGHMVDERHVLFVDQYKKIWLFSVIPTEDPMIFKRDSLALQLGQLHTNDETDVVPKLFCFLNNYTAWKFLTSCFPFPNTDIEFNLTERIG